MNRITVFLYGTLAYVTFLATFLYAVGFDRLHPSI